MILRLVQTLELSVFQAQVKLLLSMNEQKELTAATESIRWYETIMLKMVMVAE